MVAWYSRIFFAKAKISARVANLFALKMTFKVVELPVTHSGQLS